MTVKLVLYERISEEAFKPSIIGESEDVIKLKSMAESEIQNIGHELVEWVTRYPIMGDRKLPPSEERLYGLVPGNEDIIFQIEK
jgi:hypothetical protein